MAENLEEVLETNQQNQTNLRFNTLLSLGRFISFFGWLIVIAACIAILYGFGELKGAGSFALFGGIIGLINGLILVAVGQLISCFVSIEHNTFETNNILQSLKLIQSSR